MLFIFHQVLHHLTIYYRTVFGIVDSEDDKGNKIGAGACDCSKFNDDDKLENAQKYA